MRYSVICPSDRYENESTEDLQRAYEICLSLSEDYGYSEVRDGQTIIASYTNGSAQ